MRHIARSVLTASLTVVLSVPALGADPIKIGLVNETTGPNAEAGAYTVNGTRLAVDEVNAKGGIMGRPIELRIEDNQSTNPGTVLAYSKLTGEGDITGGAQGAGGEAELLVARQERHVTVPHIGSDLGELEVGEERLAVTGEGDIDQDPGHGVVGRRPDVLCG